MKPYGSFSFFCAAVLAFLFAYSGRAYPQLNPHPEDLVVSKIHTSSYRPELVAVQGGRFYMGGCPTPSVSSLPEHLVEVSSFEMSKFEITFDLYDSFCQAADRPFPPDQGLGRGARPVGCVSWHDAVDYCNWLSESCGFIPCYSISSDGRQNLVSCDFQSDGFRLPSEAEWEYAARGGQLSKGYLYSGGDAIDEVAWYFGNAGRYPKPTGGKTPNELGLFDMSGNVFEWVWDWYKSDYSWCGIVEIDPVGVDSAKNRTVRGGSCFFDEAGAVTVYKRSCPSDQRVPYLGFRVVRRPMAP